MTSKPKEKARSGFDYKKSLRARRTRTPLELDYCRGIVRAVKEVLAVNLEVEGILKLEPAEQHELEALSQRIFAERVPKEHRAVLAAQRSQEKAEAMDFAAGLESYQPPAEVTREQAERFKLNANLLAEFAREEGRPPTNEQADVILENRNLQARLVDLKLGLPASPQPLEPSVVETFSSLSGLKAAEIGRLQTLVEKAAGAPGLFQKRRDTMKLKTTGRAALEKMLKVPPRRRRHYDEPGSVTLPVLLFEHVREGILWLPDAAVLALVWSAFEARKPWSEKHRFEDDGETLVLCGRFGGSLDLDPEGRIRIDQSLAHLNRAQWLEVGKRVTVGAQRTEQPIKLGRLAIEANKRRPDES
jgi:hypothetical protein